MCDKPCDSLLYVSKISLSFRFRISLSDMDELQIGIRYGMTN